MPKSETNYQKIQYPLFTQTSHWIYCTVMVCKPVLPYPDVLLQVFVVAVEALLGLGYTGHSVSDFDGGSPHHGVEQLALSFGGHALCGEVNSVCVPGSGLV